MEHAKKWRTRQQTTGFFFADKSATRQLIRRLSIEADDQRRPARASKAVHLPLMRRGQKEKLSKPADEFH